MLGRLVKGLKRLYISFIKWGYAFVGVTYLIVTIAILTNCVPMSLYWAITDPPNKCTATQNIFIVVGTTNIITDLYIICIPIPFLWKAPISIIRKLFLAFLLCGGVFVIVVTVFRFVVSLQMVHATFRGDPAVSELGAVAIAWADREPLAAIIVVNLPCIVPILISSNIWRDRLPWVKLSIKSVSRSRGSTVRTGKTEVGGIPQNIDKPEKVEEYSDNNEAEKQERHLSSLDSSPEGLPLKSYPSESELQASGLSPRPGGHFR